MSDPVSYLYWVSGRPGSGWLVWTQTLITSHDHRPMEHSNSCQDDTWASLRKHVAIWLREACHQVGYDELMSQHGRVLTLTLAQHRWHNCHTAQIISHIPEIYYRNQTPFVHYRVSWKDDATQIDLWWARLWWWKYKVGWDDHNKTHFYFQIAQSDQTRYTAERITRICPNVRRNQFKIPPSESSSKNYKFCFALFSVVHFIG